MQTLTAILIIFATLPAANSAIAETNALHTQTGSDIGLSFSSYQYQEPGLMSLKGSKLGLDLRATKVLPDERFIQGDVRYAFGTVDYSSYGTGSASGNLDWYIETRLLAGGDRVINNAVLSFYTGLGYRYLFNDARGITSTGAAGYRRESNYFYLPIGLIHRSALRDEAILVNTLEYDHLLFGKQISKLSDTGLGLSDVTNNQSKGYGLKFSILYTKDNWAIGPFAHLWYIADSDSSIVYQNGTPVGMGIEPKNDTAEFGLRASQKF